MPNRAHELVIHCLLFFLPRTKTKKKRLLSRFLAFCFIYRTAGVKEPRNLALDSYTPHMCWVIH